MEQSWAYYGHQNLGNSWLWKQTFLGFREPGNFFPKPYNGASRCPDGDDRHALRGSALGYQLGCTASRPIWHRSSFGRFAVFQCNFADRHKALKAQPHVEAARSCTCWGRCRLIKTIGLHCWSFHVPAVHRLSICHKNFRLEEHTCRLPHYVLSLLGKGFDRFGPGMTLW